MVQNSTDFIGPSRLPKLKAAAHELRFLLSRNYPRKSSVEFVGNHHQLKKDERNILFRGVFTPHVSNTIRRGKILFKDLIGRTLVIDAYNVTITLENALRSRPLIKGNDGFIRDISGTFRGFRQSDLTFKAWELIMKLLMQYSPKKVIVLIDRPYSKSALFAHSLNRWFRHRGLNGKAILSNNVDRELKITKDVRATSDSNILVHGGPSLDLAGHIATRRLNHRPFIVP